MKVALKTLYLLVMMHLTSFHLHFGACVYLVSQLLKMGLGFFQPRFKFPGVHSQHNKSMKASLCRCAVCFIQNRINSRCVVCAADHVTEMKADEL